MRLMPEDSRTGGAFVMIMAHLQREWNLAAEQEQMLS